MTDILSGIGSTLRFMTKEVIKGGMYVMDTMSNVVSEAGEQVKNLVAEARADLDQQNGHLHEQETEEEPDKSDKQKSGERKARVRVRRSQ